MIKSITCELWVSQGRKGTRNCQRLGIEIVPPLTVSLDAAAHHQRMRTGGTFEVAEPISNYPVINDPGKYRTDGSIKQRGANHSSTNIRSPSRRAPLRLGHETLKRFVACELMRRILPPGRVSRCRSSAYRYTRPRPHRRKTENRQSIRRSATGYPIAPESPRQVHHSSPPVWPPVI